MKNNLFNDLKIEADINKYNNFLKINEPDKKPIEDWISKLNDGKLEKEVVNYGNFKDIILKRLLGYDIEDIGFEVDMGEGRPVEFVLKQNEKIIVVIELKGTKTKDLDKRYEKESAVEQVTNYASIKKETKWAIVSNYDEFRLFDPSARENYISFNFRELTDEKVLKKFLLIFSKFSLIENNLLDGLRSEEINLNSNFEDEFYKLYSETRLMLIRQLENPLNKTNEPLTLNQAIHYAQLILNRYIFICFAEDKGLIPPETIAKQLLKPIEQNEIYSFNDCILWENLTHLFRYIDEGNKFQNISKFNGGLFKENLRFLDINDAIKDSEVYYKDCFTGWNFKENEKKVKDVLGNYQLCLNPIYINLLIMSSFNFDSELDVNILGHIFENSIGDIEELKEDSKSKRKHDGIFYTKNFITDYICCNTIIPYLSKSGKINTITELINEYDLDLDILDDKLKNIKILDPACGSGAFLNKSVDILLEIHKAIHNIKYNNDNTLDPYFDNIAERRKILIDNIYGVDLNEESVEITKLGLFLKVAKKGQKLPDLDTNIKCGNSLICDSNIAGEKSFNWYVEFKEIFNNNLNKGFDIIIGNPPYIRVQKISHKEIDYYSEHYTFAQGHADISILFIELANKIIRKNGIVSFITSNMFLTTEYGENIRDFMTKNIKINHIIDFGDLNVFEDALTYVSIFNFTKGKPSNFNYYHVNQLDENLNNISFNEINISSLNKNPWNLQNFILSEIFNKINKLPSLKSKQITCNYGVITGNDDILAFKNIENINIEKDILIPFLRAEQCEKYIYVEPKEHIIYPYKSYNGKSVLLTLNEMKIKYPLLEQYLTKNKIELSKRSDSRKTLENCDDWYKLIRPSNISKFNKEKIVYQGLTKHNKFAIDNTGSACVGGGVFFIISDNPEVSIKYVLAILNSNIVESYLHSITPLKKGGYHKYSTNTINKLPFPFIPSENQKQLILKVDNILNLNEKLITEIKTFQKWLKGTFNIEKLSNKLKLYYTLTFKEFLIEVKKKNVNVKPRKTQKLLEEEFNDSLKIIKPLRKQINLIDNELNVMVYELYGIINDKDIELIESTLNS